MPKLSDAAILTEATHNYRVSVRHQQKWKREAKKGFRFYAGDQLNDDDKHKLEQEKRPVVTFNMVGPNVDAVVGMQRANRTEIRFSALDGAAQTEQQFADWANGLLKKCDEDCDAEMETSDAFKDAVICGVGWTQRTIDYDADPRGLLVKRTIDPLRKWYDPTARRHNLVDRKFDFTEVYLDTWEFEALYPDAKKRGIIPGTGPDSPAGNRPGGDPFSVGGEEHEQFDTETEHEEAQDPYRGEHSSPDGYERMKDKIRLIEYNYWKWEKTYRVFSQPEDKMIPEDEWEDFEVNIRLSGKQLVEVAPEVQPGAIDNPTVIFYQEVNKKQHYKATFAGPYLLHHDLNIDPTNFNEHCITGSLDRSNNLFYGIVKSMIDPQMWSNKLFMQIMLVVMSNPKGGAYYLKGAFTNPEKAKEDYAGASNLIEVKDRTADGLKITDQIQERQPSPYPQGLHEVMSYAAGVIPKVTGLNLELLGMAQKDQPGILEHLRQQAGMTILATIFDSLKAYHKSDGRSVLYLLRNEIPPERQAEILGKENAQLAQVVAALPQGLDRFAIHVDEAPYSPNRKFLVFKMLTDIGTTNPELQSMLTPLLLDYMPLPEAATSQIKQQMQQASQSSQQDKQQTQQVQIMQAIAEIKEMMSHGELYEAQARQADSKIAHGDVQTAAQAVADLGSAAHHMGQARAMHAEAALTEKGVKVEHPAKPVEGASQALPLETLKNEPMKTN